MGGLQVAYLNLAPSGAHLYPIRISGNLKIQASFNFDEKISLIEVCQGPKLMPPYRSSTIPLPDPPKPFCHQITLRVLFWDMSNLSLLDFASRALLARPWFLVYYSQICLSVFNRKYHLSCCLGREDVVDNELAKYCQMIAPLVQLFDLDVIVLRNQRD